MNEQKRRRDTVPALDWATLKKMIDGTADGVAFADPDNVIVYANKAYHRLYGYEYPEMVGTGIRDYGVPASIQEKLLEVDGAQREEGFWEGEREILDKDGETCPVMLSTTTIKGDSGDSLGRVVILRDISKFKEVEGELKRANMELEGYARTVAHDLKGPLTTIILETQNLAEAAEEDDVESLRTVIEEAADAIERNVERCYTLIDDLLLLARLDQKPRKIVEVDIRSVVMDVIEGASTLVEQEGASFDIDDGLGTVRAVELHMLQLFGNLIDNALVHPETDNVEITVRRLPYEGGRHSFLVRDNGHGFDDTIADEMFLPFISCEKHNGVGIGLATVKRVVELYGGKMRAYNDGGACFEFSIADWTDEPEDRPSL